MTTGIPGHNRKTDKVTTATTFTCDRCGREFPIEVSGVYVYANGTVLCPPCWKEENPDAKTN